MEWSPQQDKALLAFKRWLRDRDEDDLIFRLFGYAGTGKTSIALELTQDVDGEVIFGAFTGKAASVMRKKGCGGARTLHSLLYNVRQAGAARMLALEEEKAALLESSPDFDPRTLARIEREIIEVRKVMNKPAWDLNPISDAQNAALIVVDEVSMVDTKLGEDLLSFGRPILALGDPAQLPPVKGTGFFHSNQPNVMLTEVHRHALDNPILHMATEIRKGNDLRHGAYGESRIIRKTELQGGETMDFDQILVGRNATRQFANRKMRERLGYAGTFPLQGEKVVCLKNNRQNGLLNGTIWSVNSCVGDEDSVEISVTSEEGGDPVETIAHGEPFVYKEAPRWGNQGLDEFTYGYALTTHKAQGSEWPNVYLVDESSAFRGDADKWLYTAVTRASEKLLMVR